MKFREYLDEVTISKNLKNFFNNFNPKDWDKEAVKMYKEFKNNIEKGKGKEALKILQNIIRQDTSKLNNDVVKLANKLIKL